MINCPNCNNTIPCRNFLLITRKKLTCTNCKTIFFAVKKSQTVIIEALLFTSLGSGYISLRHADYSPWVLVLPFVVVFMILKSKIPNDFIVARDITQSAKKAEFINLSLAGFVVLIFALWIGLLFR